MTATTLAPLRNGATAREAPVVPMSSAWIPRLGTYCMIAAALVALAYCTDPENSGWGANRVAVLKYLPLELATLAAGVYSLATPRPRVNWTVRAYQALCVFMLFGSIMTLGSGAAIEDSFLGRALGIVVVYPAYRMFSSRDETRRFARPYRRAILTSSIVITLLLAVWQAGIHFVDQPHIFHEEVLIPAAAILLVWMSVADPALRIAGASFLLAGVLLTNKNTGFLAALVALGLIATVAWQGRDGMARAARIAVRVLLLAVVTAAIVAVGSVVLWFADLLPSGSPRVRVITYALRIGQFVGSPLVGHAWIGTPLVQLSPTFREPSHSDVLDIAAFGGLTSLALFAAPLIAFARHARRDLLIFAARRHWLGGFFSAALLVFLVQMWFNPMWNQPELVVHFWLAIGFFAARAQQRRRAPATSGAFVG